MESNVSEKTMKYNRIMKMNHRLSIMAATLCLCVACDTDEEVSVYGEVLRDFKTQMGGKVDPSQLWRTAITFQLSLVTDQPMKVQALSVDNAVPTCFDRKEISGSGLVTMTIPQGYGPTVKFSFSNGQISKSLYVDLEGTPTQALEVDLRTMGFLKGRQLPMDPWEGLRASVPTSLQGKSVIGSSFYTELPVQTVLESQVVREGVDASTRTEVINYELLSKGSFNIAFVSGFTGLNASRILGYYYHSPGTYSDLTFVDLTETQLYDVIDEKPKMQYQLDEKAASSMAWQPFQWYDANFDHQDGFEPPYTVVQERLNDDVYNIEFVFQKFGTSISRLRGISFHIDVPANMYVGFYLKSSEVNVAQRNKWLQLGVPEDRFPANFPGMNCSAMALNIDGKHRSFIYTDNGLVLMGMEDNITGGDNDCNDVVFGLFPDRDNPLPQVVDPEIDDINGQWVNLPWTIAYEDVARGADFDFNDAVIRLTPDFEKEEITVDILAAGCTSKMWLHYDGPEGDVNLGEIHELLGEELTPVNTRSSVATVKAKTLSNLPWPRDYTMGEDASRFYIEVQRGTCDTCSDAIFLPKTPGEMPEAICVAGEWKWPKEGVSIFTAYSQFEEWANDITQMDNWNWHTLGDLKKTVSYTKR